jgi:hypothetical protein
MITVTFYAPTKLARYIQLAVMRGNGYFVRNPYLAWGEESRFDISFEDGPKYNRFMNSVNTFKQPWF